MYFWRESSPIERFIVVTIVILVLAILGQPIVKIVGIPVQYSDGERTGVVVKISKKGFFWKTWEGNMNTGAMSTDGEGVAVPVVWEFSVVDEGIVREIQEAAKGGERITLHYDQPIALPWRKGSSGYLVTGASRKQPL